MTLYLDTSVLVAALVPETTTAAVQAWLAAQPAGSLHVSDWVMTELSSALSIKLRTGQLDLAERSLALSAGHQLAMASFEVLPVTRRHFQTAALYADRHDLGLRAGDALHLAVVVDQGLTMCTRDVRMAEAGPALGISTQLID